MAKTYQKPEMTVVKFEGKSLLQATSDGGGGGIVHARETIFEDFKTLDII